MVLGILISIILVVLEISFLGDNFQDILIILEILKVFRSFWRF